jgi:hypothetical protein
MAKFGGSATTATRTRAPIHSEGPAVTHEGGRGFTLNPEGELFLLAATNFVNEDAFYEDASTRDKRFAELVHAVTKTDPEWVARFAPYLRNELRMRSASVVLACEYVAAGGPNGRGVIDSVCQRADEPAEVLAYWHANHGRNEPKPVKRGVADAARRLYTERNVLKYDSDRRSFKFGDVIERVHPEGKDERQDALFTFLLDESHHKDGKTEGLPVLEADARTLALAEGERRAFVRANGMPESWAWERLAGWLPGGMDAEAWEAAIPNMGVMALLRNLRNFDNKGISDAAIDKVIAKITDPDEVARSRMFPYRAWVAYKEAPSDNWRRALGRTLDLTLTNMPRFAGRTLVLVDRSGSMWGKMSARSSVSRDELAASMGAAVALANKGDIAPFADTSVTLRYEPGTSALRLTEMVTNTGVGGGTRLVESIRKEYDGHDRVIVFTDDQSFYSMESLAHIPKIYTFDLAGYRVKTQDNGKNGRFVVGGFSDASLVAFAALETAGHADWPF